MPDRVLLTFCELIDWMAQARLDLGVPVWVMGDFNRRWSECAEALKESGVASVRQIAYVPPCRRT